MKNLEVSDDSKLTWNILVSYFAEKLKQELLKNNKKPTLQEAKIFFTQEVAKDYYQDEFNFSEIDLAWDYLQSFALKNKSEQKVLQTATKDFQNRIEEFYLGNLKHSVEDF